MVSPSSEGPEVLTSGMSGLDDILRGGFPANSMYLIAGVPGSGKTTLGMQFLIAGVEAGETCLYVTLSESEAEIQQVARSHGWNLNKLHISELIPSDQNLSPDGQLTVFNPSEFELGETTQAMMAEVERLRPKRVVIDSLSELRLVAQHALRFRRQILGLKQFFMGRDCTVLLLDDRSSMLGEEQLESIAHGVVVLEHLANQYGAERRRLRVSKLRGVGFRGGYHDFAIRAGGIDIFPRLVAAEHHVDFPEEHISSGNAELDRLMGGGLPRGTSTLLLGPAGAGKSTIATQFASTNARMGGRTAMFVFDENLGTLRMRSRKLGMAIDEHVKAGLITISQIDPAELSPGEFAVTVRRAVEGVDANGQAANLIVIDSLNGYLNAMPEEKFLTAQFHELLTYLGQKGVATILSVTQSGMVGSAMHSPVDTTYLADNVILFRYFEAFGEVHKAISVVKKRSGPHERSIRELRVTKNGLTVGEELREFQGVLSGVPTFHGTRAQLIAKDRDGQ